jgi:hypothetical protein
MYKDLLPSDFIKKQSRRSPVLRDLVGAESIQIRPDTPQPADTGNAVYLPGDLPSDNGIKSAALTSTDGNIPVKFRSAGSALRVLDEAMAPLSSQKSKTIVDFFKPSNRKSPTPEEPPNSEDSIGITNHPQKLVRSQSDLGSLVHDPANLSLSSRVGTLPAQQCPIPSPRSSPKVLQKSLSDPSSIKLKFGDNRTYQTFLATGRHQFDSSVHPDDEEQGPWTSEALYLFDWWPSGRPKPAGVGVC